VAAVDPFHHQVGDGDVDRHAGGDDGGDAQVAQHGVEVGAAHGVEAVGAREDDVRGVDPDLGDDLGGRRARQQLDRRPVDPGEEAGVAVGTLAVGPALERAVDDLDPGRPG